MKVVQLTGSKPPVAPPSPLVIGIDPGLSGALAVFDAKTRKIHAIVDMPVTQRGSKKTLDIYALADTIRIFSDELKLAVLEDVSAMTYVNAEGEVRGQGAAASFSFGKTMGVVEGVLAVFGIPILYVKPAVWKMAVGVSSSKSSSLALARKVFPESVAFFALRKHDGRAEAALLARFGADRFK
jgi:crossover junction endodeoxyribonuclease RuvC